MTKLNRATQRIPAVLHALLFIALSVPCFAQVVPQGVNYKKASADVNGAAKIALEQALADRSTPTKFINGVVSCGPILWNDLKDQRELLSKDSTPVTMFLSVPQPVQAEGRGFRTQEQRDTFWKLVTDRYPELRKGVVRVANPNEINFYWATIPFDIEEPFFVVETPSNAFVFDLTVENGTPILFWIDRVDDLRKLRK